MRQWSWLLLVIALVAVGSAALLHGNVVVGGALFLAVPGVVTAAELATLRKGL